MSPPDQPDQPQPPESLTLSADAPRRTGLARDLKFYAALYATPIQTIKRWRREGETAKPVDTTPLDDPKAMIDWWARHHTWRVPDGILAAANAAPKETSTPDVPAPASDPAIPVPDKTEATGEKPTPTAVPVNLINLADQTLAEDEEVIQAQQAVKATFLLFELALQGKGGNAQLCQRNWKLARDALIQTRRDVAARKAQAGEFVPIEAVKHDLAVLCENLRQMDETTIRLVLELMPGLPPEWRLELERAHRVVFAKRAGIFQRGVGTEEFSLSAA